jgi:hypothetical protein
MDMEMPFATVPKVEVPPSLGNSLLDLWCRLPSDLVYVHSCPLIEAQETWWSTGPLRSDGRMLVAPVGETLASKHD